MPTPAQPRFRAVRLLIAGFLAVGAMVTAAASVAAYPPSPTSSNLVVSCTTVPPGGSCTITFHLVDTQGNPIAGAAVQFSVTGVPGASVVPSSATTDQNGNATATFFAGNQGCGTATITATSQGFTAQTQVNVTCTNAGVTLPNTSALPPSDHHTAAFVGLAAALTVLLAGTVVFGMARRRTD